MIRRTGIRKCFALGMLIVMLCCAASGQAEGVFEAQATVTFGQSDARAMLTLINDFRTGSDAWYWNEDNTEKIARGGDCPVLFAYAAGRNQLLYGGQSVIR